MYLQIIYFLYIYEEDIALNNLQWLISQKNKKQNKTKTKQKNKTNKPTKPNQTVIFYMYA